MKKPTTKLTPSRMPRSLSMDSLARVAGGTACRNPETGEEITVRGLACPEGWEKIVK